MIDLPTSPAPTDGQPMLRDFGGVLTPFLGGPEQRINRVGTRWGIRVTLPTMESNVLGRNYVSKLMRGREEGVRLRWPLNDFDPGTPGTPLVRIAASGGTTLSIKGLAVSYPIKEGQFFSLIVGGQRYIYMFAANVTANGLGDADATIFPSLRTSVAVDDVLEIEQPIIEGFVSPGDELMWEISSIRRITASFSVMESA